SADVRRADRRAARPACLRARRHRSRVRDGADLLLVLLLLHRPGQRRLMGAPVPRLPLLAPWYRLVGDGDRLLLEHGSSLVVLEGAAVGALLPALLPLLDGTRTLDQLAERLGRAARPAIEQAVATLAEHDV